MKKLDLHGVKHKDVGQRVDTFLYENINCLPVEIVTGYSDKMKELVIQSIEDHNLEYQIGDTLKTNLGFIKVF